ncbi:MAG: hypothetical protein HYV07_30925 [Deltaproteobacteria bacterium]|nr:hypothetical protein [Deltaproteobacteria bacterium]
MNDPERPNAGDDPSAAPTELDPRRPPYPAPVVVRMRGPSEDGGLKTIGLLGLAAGFVGAAYVLFGDQLRGIPSAAEVWKVIAASEKSLAELCPDIAAKTKARLSSDSTGHVVAVSVKSGPIVNECATRAIEDWRLPKLSSKAAFLAIEFDFERGRMGSGAAWFAEGSWDVRNVDSPLDKSATESMLGAHFVDALECVMHHVVVFEGIDGGIRDIAVNFDVTPAGGAIRVWVGDNAAVVEQGGSALARNRPRFQGCVRSIIEGLPLPTRTGTDRANVMSVLTFSTKKLE